VLQGILPIFIIVLIYLQLEVDQTDASQYYTRKGDESER
jgi:hypothetical protein